MFKSKISDGGGNPPQGVGQDGTMQPRPPPPSMTVTDRGAEKKLWGIRTSNVHLVCQMPDFRLQTRDD